MKDLEAPVHLIKEQIARSDELGRATLNFALSDVERLIERVRKLEDGLREMCELAEFGVRNQDSFGESWVEKRLARIAELRALLAKEKP